MEFLRAEHAHRRLGFAQAQIASWFAEAGLVCDLSEEIRAPGGAGEQLTVMLWRGCDRRKVPGPAPKHTDVEQADFEVV
jgi:hypothetical protein